MKKRVNYDYDITVTVPHQEVGHFNVRGLKSSDQQTATFYLTTCRGNSRAAKQTMGRYENTLEEKGVNNFSLQATPFKER